MSKKNQIEPRRCSGQKTECFEIATTSITQGDLFKSLGRWARKHPNWLIEAVNLSWSEEIDYSYPILTFYASPL